MTERIIPALRSAKPRLRGWLHAATAPLALAAGIVLIAVAPSGPATVAAVIFTVTAVLLFSTSATYHLGRWRPAVDAVLRRMDHANIFLIIAGTYTPFALLLPSDQGRQMLAIVWSGALIGVAFRVLWPSAPRWLYVPVYLALGWVAVFYLRGLLSGGGPAIVTLIIVGGVLYSVGALVYAAKRPNPLPRWFGFHEIFHAFTVAAFVAHYVAASLTLYGSAGQVA